MNALAARWLLRPITLSIALASAAVVVNACSGGPSRPAERPGAAAMSSAALPAGEGDSDAFPCTLDDVELCVEHAYRVVDGMVGLGQLQRTRDKRSIPAGLAALSSADAQLQYEGLRLLGPWSQEPGVPQAVLPFLLNSRPKLRQMAVRIVKDTPVGLEVGEQYAKGHPKEDNFDPYDRDPSVDPSVWGHVAFPGSSPYPPGDSARSLGLSTTVPVEEVTRFYEHKAGRARVDNKAYAQLQAAGAIPMMQQIQNLMLEYERTKDPALMTKLQEVSQAGSGGGQAGLPLPGQQKAEGSNVVIMDANNPRARVVIVYREPAFERTVALLAWDPAVYKTEVPTTKPLRYKAAPKSPN